MRFFAGDYSGIVWDPCDRATRPDRRTFDHGSFEVRFRLTSFASEAFDVGLRDQLPERPASFKWSRLRSMQGPGKFRLDLEGRTCYARPLATKQEQEAATCVLLNCNILSRVCWDTSAIS